MMFMNENAILEKKHDFAWHPVLGPATVFLHAFMREVNAHSDGWPYWAPPVKSAAQLMTLIQAGPMGATEDAYKRALKPIKSFMTRRGRSAGMNVEFP